MFNFASIHASIVGKARVWINEVLARLAGSSSTSQVQCDSDTNLSKLTA